MFQSIIYKTYDYNKRQYLYELTDSEFGTCAGGVAIAVAVGVAVGAVVAVAQEYQRRNLPIAENIALFNIWYHKKYGRSFSQIKDWQDKYYPEYINNWLELSPQIDKLIEKYLLIQ